MRIALVHYTFWPVVGGVETVMQQHAELFAEAGHEVTVVCSRGESDHPAVRMAHFPPPPRLAGALARQLGPLLAEQDVVFLHNVLTMHFDPELTATLWELAGDLRDVRFFSWIHDLAAVNPDYSLPPLDAWPWSCLASAHERISAVTVSENRRQQWESLSGASSRVIPNGVDPRILLRLTDGVAQLAGAAQLFEADVVLLHPARLLKRKDIEFGFETVAELKASGLRVRHLVTGPPDAQNPLGASYEGELRQRRRELKIEGEAIFLHDHFAVTNDDMASLLAVADALFFPSRQEGFGIPILEAAVHRLPVFCRGLPPMNTILPDATFCFSPDASARQVAAMMSQHIGRSHIIQARKTALRDYAWEAVYQKHLAPLLASLSL